MATGAGSRGPHLPVSHSFALEFAVGVRPQARQLLLASEGPVPLLAAAVVHAVALTGRKAATETATLYKRRQPRATANARTPGPDRRRARDVTVTCRRLPRRFRSRWGWGGSATREGGASRLSSFWEESERRDPGESESGRGRRNPGSRRRLGTKSSRQKGREGEGLGWKMEVLDASYS